MFTPIDALFHPLEAVALWVVVVVLVPLIGLGLAYLCGYRLDERGRLYHKYYGKDYDDL